MQSNHTVFTILVASTTTWLVALRVPGSEKPHLHRVDGSDTAALLALIVNKNSIIKNAFWADAVKKHPARLPGNSKQH